MASPSPFDALQLDHVAFHVENADATADWLVGGYGLRVRAVGDDGTGGRTMEIGGCAVRLLVTEAATADHPAARYTAAHGDGINDIAFGVPDVAAAFAEAVRRGAVPIAEPVARDGFVTAVIAGFGDVTHTFVQRPENGQLLPGLRPAPVDAAAIPGPLRLVDHFAACVDPGTIDQYTRFYQDVLDFDLIFTETLQIGPRAMTTKVVQSRTGTVTLTFIEPDATQASGHIDEFLEAHGGPGVQHIAFATEDIIDAVARVRARGVAFMDTPGAYYDDLAGRLVPARYGVERLREHEVLVDEDHDGQLYQIFARSVHPRNTIFVELIERMGARSFGSGNITALYQSAERQRSPRNDAQAA